MSTQTNTLRWSPQQTTLSIRPPHFLKTIFPCLLLVLSSTMVMAEDYASNTTVTENVDDGMVIFSGVTVTVAANIFVSGGTIDIKPNGTLIILSGVTLSTDQDIVNDNGTITINGNIDTSGSKFENKAGGTVNGSGSIFFSGGTSVLNNDGSSFFGFTGNNPTGPGGPCDGGECSLSILPITLVDFTAKIQRAQVVLNWTTAAEVNNDFFTIERSTDGAKWEVIQEVKGAGTSIVDRQYTATDYQPVKGVNYYRLRQTDFDGSFSLSGIKAVDIKADLTKPVHVFPNPTSGHLSIQTSIAEQSNPRIFTLQGVEITDQVAMNKAVGNKYSLDLSRLPSGVYILQTSSGSTKVHKQ